MFPAVSPATKTSFPKVTHLRRFAVDDVTLSKDDPLSVDNTIFPELPTPRNIPEPEEVEEELSEEDASTSEDEERVKVPFEHGETLSA